jgi:iron complex transport system substrate-binding protein
MMSLTTHTRGGQSPSLLMALALAVVAGQAASQPPAAPARIVCLVPAVTEMLFAIGAGPRVVGVSSYDTYPADVVSRTRVGALIDPDVERILSLRPDLVVVYGSQVDLKHQMARAGIPVFDYAHGGLAHVTATIRRLGQRLGLTDGADRVAAGIEARLDAVRRRVEGRPRPPTLLVFARDPLALRNVSASGGVGFLHDLLVLGGGDNIFGRVRRESVQVTSETILARAPEVIVELRYGRTLSPADVDRERAVWNTLPSVPAVRRGRVAILLGDDLVVPGPRIAQAAERLARALHPEAFE